MNLISSLDIEEQDELKNIVYDVDKFNALKKFLDLLIENEEGKFLGTLIDEENPTRMVHEKCRLEGMRKFRMYLERDLMSLKKNEQKTKVRKFNRLAT